MWENFAKAIEYHKKSLKINPDNLVSYLNLGVTQVKAGEYRDAIETFEKVIQKEPMSVFPYYYWGLSNLKIGNVNKAKLAIDALKALLQESMVQDLKKELVTAENAPPQEK